MTRAICRAALCGVFLTAVVAAPGVGQAKKPSKKSSKKAKKKAKKKISKKAKKQAKRMARVGKAAYKKGKWDDAVLAFTGAYDADGNPKWLYNVARCHEKAEQPFKAMEFYERYLTEFPDAKDREEVETVAGFLRLKLEKTYGRLVVRSKPEMVELEVTGGDKPVDGETPWSGWLVPGRYVLTLTSDGLQDFTQKVRLKAGDTAVIEAELKPPPPPEPAPPAVVEAPEPDKPGPDVRAEAPAPDTVPPPPDDAGGIGTPAVVSLVVAGVALAGFVALGALASSEEGEFDDKKGDLTQDASDLRATADSANTMGMAANVSLGVAIAAGLTGGILAWTF